MLHKIVIVLDVKGGGKLFNKLVKCKFSCEMEQDIFLWKWDGSENPLPCHHLLSSLAHKSTNRGVSAFFISVRTGLEARSY